MNFPTCKGINVLLVIAAYPSLGHATVHVKDDWSSGVRNVRSLPQRSTWYYTNSTGLVAQPGSITATIDSSRLAITYFTESTPYALSDGETLMVTVEFTPSNYNADQHLRVTLHHNLPENPYMKDSRIGTRVPSLRFGKAHIFNSVYCNLGEGIRTRHDTAHILVEENVFDYLGYTWFSDDVGCFTLGYNLMINEANKDAREVPVCDPDFESPYDYAAFLDVAEDVEAIVTEGVGVGKIDPLEGLP